MNIKTKLSFQFTIIVAGILIFFSAMVYYFSYTSQLSRFRDNLTEKAKNTAILLINVVEVDSTLLQKIHRSTLSLHDEEIALTDSAFEIIYKYNLKYLSKSVLWQNADANEISFFSIAEKDGVCYKHNYKNRIYSVFVMAYDKSRKENLADLLDILFWSNLISIWVSILLSYSFSRKAIKPIANIIKNVKNINSSNLSNRLGEGRNKDEIAQLAVTFNDMLANLEIAFKNQEEFVSNASHELRTPLTIMIVESDYLLSHDQKPEEYRKHIRGLIGDLKKLNLQLNSLLELAQINQENTIQLSVLRVDELLFDAIREIKPKYPERKIISRIQYSENENELLIHGNPGMLNIAFKNLIDNACKFSDDNVTIETEITTKHIRVIITDHGIGIPSDELETIFKPFSRASNVRYKSGFGIGLSLVAKVLSLQAVTFNAYSNPDTGTQFVLLFEKIDFQKTNLTNLA